MAKLLLVEDDTDLATIIETELTIESHTVEIFGDGLDAEEALKGLVYDLIILDWNLPGKSGIEILTSFRESGGITPVLMLTAQNAIESRTLGLDQGADDYLCKPFDMRELVSRVRSLLRRPAQFKPNSMLTFGNLILDPANSIVTKENRPLRLLPRDFALLEFFVRHPHETFSVEALMGRVWSYDSDCTPGGVRTAITRLRRAIDDDSNDSIIENVPRVGYRLRRT